MVRTARLSAAFVVVALLGTPGITQAASPFAPFVAQGPFVLSLGTEIHPAGVSGRFVVPSRRVFGFLLGSVNAPFMIQFATNVPIATQSGNVHGTLYICENATPLPGLGLFGCVDPATLDLNGDQMAFLLSLDTAILQSTAVSRKGRVALTTSLGAGADPLHPLLNVNGIFTFTGGSTQGNGDVDGFLTLILDAEGHIVGVGDSNVVFSGDWTGP